MNMYAILSVLKDVCGTTGASKYIRRRDGHGEEET